MVLILILMEHAQRGLSSLSTKKSRTSLNPYFNGTCSKSGTLPVIVGRDAVVLILILMEYAQREHFFIRPSVLICYIEIFTLINAFASEKCTCFLLKTLQR